MLTMPHNTGNVEKVRGLTLAELVEETRGKVHLKERDANAFYESSEVKKLKHEAQIAKMRQENKQKRIELSRVINGDEEVIKSVFNYRKEELLSMLRFTAEKANSVMDWKVCEARKQLNASRHEKHVKSTRLEELNAELSHLRLVNLSETYDDARQQEIRRIQNELDKAAIKLGAAQNITWRYEAIMDKLQEEVRNYPAVLDDLEDNLEKATTELSELRKMNEKAIKASEEARQELHTLEREMYQAKRARDQQLNLTRKAVEKRKEPGDRTERRQRINIIGESSDSRAAKLQMQKAEYREKILTLEDAFEKIKRAIHVSDMESIVYRLTNQSTTFDQLRAMEKEKTMKKHKLEEELARLRTTFEELKFTSERQMQKGRKVVEEMAEYVRKEDQHCTQSTEICQKHDKLLIDLQSGIATLFEKLKEVRLKPPYHNFAKGDPVEDLLQCGRKVDLLLNNLGLKKGVSIPQKVESEKLHQYLETRLPADNIRIRIDMDDMSDSDDFQFDHDQENEGFTSREDIKRQGQEILNSNLKPKKKKRKRAS